MSFIHLFKHIVFMKNTIKSILALAAIVAVFASCNKEVATSNIKSGEPIDVSFSLAPKDATKSSSASTFEKTINNFQIFVFNENGTLDAAGKQTGNTPLTLLCTTGPKRIYALVNHSEDITKKTENEKALLAVKSYLQDNRYTTDPNNESLKGGFVLFGKETQTLSKEPVTVEVAHIASQVSLGKITNSLNPALGKLTINGVYCVNVTGEAILGDDTYCPAATATWYNKKAYTKLTDNSLLHVNDLISHINADASKPVINNDSYDTSFYCLYVYPNTTSADNSDATFSPRYTRLVIDATIEKDVDGSGNPIPHRYYPIDLVVKDNNNNVTATLGRNKTYKVTNLKITRPGSLDPDKPLVINSVEYKISVADWDEGFSKDVEL